MNTAQLLHALNLAAPALQSKEFIPVLTHFCFDKDSVFAYDDKAAVVVFEKNDLHCAVPGKVLLEMLRGAGSEIELVQHLKHSELIIQDGSSTVRLSTLGSESFTFKLKDLNGDGQALLDTITLPTANALELAASLANAEAVRPGLIGVSFVSSNKSLTLYSTDNETATSIALPIRTGATLTGIIPQDSCILIAKTFKEMDKMEGLEVAELNLVGANAVATFVHTTLPTVVVATKLIPAKMEDFPGIIAKSTEGVSWFPLPSQLVAAAKQAVALTKKDQDKAMQLILRSGSLGIAAKGRFGEFGTNIDIESLEVDEEETYSVEPRLVVRALDWAAEFGLGSKALAFRGDIGENIKVTHVISRKVVR
jgi:DNA polymerase III sliding clamp (beta) subunit (PCNA family)